MTLHFPDEVETNVLTIDATDPKSGTAEFKATAIRVEKLRRRSAASRARRGGRRLSGSASDSRASRPAAERDAVDAVLGDRRPRPGTARSAAATASPRAAATPPASQRHLLLPVLHEVQGRIGWISPAALGYVCRRLTIPPAEAYGVASFYALFALEPRPPTVAHVCTDIACMCRGGAELVAELERERRARPGEPTADGAATWLRSPCLGLCERAPAALVTRRRRGPRATHSIGAAPATAGVIGGPRPGRPPSRRRGWCRRSGRARRCGCCGGSAASTRTSLDSYRGAGGYAALRRAFELGPAGVIRELTDSKLLGRGGAAFPTGRKWEAVARNPVRPHYLVCNADESEPGTFKDRVVIENDPFALVEAMTIAGVRHRLRAGLPLPARRVPAGVASG